jgi:hypothetical protein
MGEWVETSYQKWTYFNPSLFNRLELYFDMKELVRVMSENEWPAMIGQGSYGGDSPKMIHQPSLKQRLDMAVNEAEKKLADVKRAREIFDKNPELEELLNIMQRGRF